MSKNLEDEIRKAATSGRLDILSVMKCPSGYQGNFRSVGKSGWGVQIAADPVEALLRALDVAAAPAAPDPKQGDIFE